MAKLGAILGIFAHLGDPRLQKITKNENFQKSRGQSLESHPRITYSKFQVNSIIFGEVDPKNVLKNNPEIIKTKVKIVCFKTNYIKNESITSKLSIGLNFFLF